MISEAFMELLQNPVIFLCVFAGVVVGIVFGAIPGLTGTMSIVIFLPVTYAMSSLEGIGLLLGLFIGGTSGGLISAILLNIPGTPSSISTCFDGYPMAQRGEGAKALGTAVLFSFLGTLFGIAVLMLLMPFLTELALKFGAFEYCALAIMSFSIVVSLTGKDMLKGFISVAIGAMFATVGLSPIDSMQRFTFGNFNLYSGFKLLVVLIGLFAMTEVAKFAEKKASPETFTVKHNIRIKGFGISFKEFIQQLPNAIRSALIGTGIGILPGIGASVSNVVAYTASKNASGTPEKYGTGIIDGVVASETANNATIGGAMLPLLSLGIPGDGATAVLLGALMIHGISPGPLIFEKSGTEVYGIFIIMILASLFMLFIELFAIPLFVRLLKIPGQYLYPFIVVFCCVGAIGSANRIFDCWGIVIFGIIGYLLVKFDFPLVPMVLGFILGPLLELNLRRASMVWENSSLLEHPIAIVFIVLTILSVVIGLRNQKV